MFSTNLIVAQHQFQLQGEPSKFRDEGDSGMPVWRHFCNNCGSPVFTVAESMPGIIIVKVGTLDDASNLQPAIEVYAKHAAKWLLPLADVIRFEYARST